LGLIYNRPRDATVVSKAGAVVWKFVTNDFQQLGGPVPLASQQLQVMTAAIAYPACFGIGAAVVPKHVCFSIVSAIMLFVCFIRMTPPLRTRKKNW
jgi:hypothetical protein